MEFIKWFSELNKNSGNIAGGKGANLAEIYNLKVPVPPGFVVTAQAYDYFIEKAGIKEKIQELLSRINYEDTKQLNKITKQIRELILKAKFPREMEEEILESYEHLNAKDPNIQKGPAMDILKTASEPVFVAVRSSATAEDLADASFAGQQDSFVNVKGNTELLENIKKCFASLFTARATYYRHQKGFDHAKVSLAAVVQDMVDSDKSGVIFSKDPSYNNDQVHIEAVWGLGEGIVSGKITPDIYTVNRKLKILDKKIANKKIALTRNSGGNKIEVKLKEEISNSQVLKQHEIKKLADIAIKLEEHFKKPQDIEFAIERGEIYIVQTRPVTTMEKRIDKTSKELNGEIILTGIAASPGIASGKIKIVEKLEDLHKINKGDILVTKMTNPDMVVTMQKSAAIVTDEGGLTAHAAIVSREMGIPSIVGTQEATTKLKEGETITVDGFTGKVYKGKIAETVQKEVLPVAAETKTKIKVIVDLPSFAERAARSKIKEVGLTRIEGIIAESGKHPNYFLQKNQMKDYEELIFNGVNDIAKYFDKLWIRTSDIRSDEFQNLKAAPEEKEANPMLGMHGIRYGLKNPDVLKSELKALKRITEKGKEIGLLLPQIISVEEVRQVKKFLQEINASKIKVGVMVETPAAVQLIRELCDEGIDFISFGTNDLTQYILAVDRGNEQVQNIYNEMHPAILPQLEYVIRVCKRNNVETSICGQAGSKKEMARFLVEKGIDSISVNADMAKEIAKHIAEVEKELIKDTDQEPRQYQPEEKISKQDFVKPQGGASTFHEEDTSSRPQNMPEETAPLPIGITSKEEGLGVPFDIQDETSKGKETNEKPEFEKENSHNEEFDNEPEFSEKQDDKVLDIF
ncbi:phosphoenolpyruvate synthase [Candidatus Pacearchaeota archaeon]|nr:phosphoenolpyruvate synthase [Candidatus Pacearchaeota archaeon]